MVNRWRLDRIRGSLMMGTICRGRWGFAELTRVKMECDEGGNELDGLSHLLQIVDSILRVRRILLAKWHDSAIDVLALTLLTFSQDWEDWDDFSLLQR